MYSAQETNRYKAPPCCKALKGLDWEKELCKACTSTAEDPAIRNDEIRKCCERKHRLSKLIMKCNWRRYTRNGGCQNGHGNCINVNPDGACFTCEDLARQHNGGPCGHRRTATNSYWEKIKKALCNIGGGCEDCAKINIDCANKKFTPVDNSACPKPKEDETEI